MSQRQEMQQWIALKRALEKDMGIVVDMQRYGVQQRLLRLARASEDPEVIMLARALERDPELVEDGEKDPLAEDERIKGYYRGRPIYRD
ncbi:hypothetical protein P8631_08395 [Guyparkeria sp. 1SP6A2]|nr:hypothetical protein [Guyparkeria sp. 1SP6A2]